MTPIDRQRLNPLVYPALGELFTLRVDLEDRLIHLTYYNIQKDTFNRATFSSPEDLDHWCREFFAQLAQGPGRWAKRILSHPDEQSLRAQVAEDLGPAGDKGPPNAGQLP